MSDQQHNFFDDIREAAEQKADQAIDQFAGKVPGGQQYSQQAKDAMGGIFNNLEQQGENYAGNMTHNQGQPGQHTPLDEGRQVAEQQVDQAIDQFASKIPGGQQFSQQAKEAAGGVLNNLENELEQHAGDMLGGLFGHHDKKQ